MKFFSSNEKKSNVINQDSVKDHYEMFLKALKTAGGFSVGLNAFKQLTHWLVSVIFQ